MTDIVHFDKYGNKKIVQPAGYTTPETPVYQPVRKKKPPTLVDVFKA
jgi:hypothetical protein